MAGRSPKSPNVNNLISFWSDIEVPTQPSPSASASPPASASAPVPIPGRGNLQPRIAGSRSAADAGRRPTAQLGSSPALFSSSSSPPSSSPPSLGPLLQRGSAPLFPLRSVAPPQSRVFGTQRHALDTINIRPGNPPPPVRSPPGHPRPRTAQHSAPQLISPNSASNTKRNNVNDATAQHRPIRNPNTRPATLPASPPSLTNLSSPTSPTSRVVSSSSERSTAPTRQGQGILKLAVIPPAQSKDDPTLKHYQHPARSHPLSATSEPLGTPLDALLPLGKR